MIELLILGIYIFLWIYNKLIKSYKYYIFYFKENDRRGKCRGIDMNIWKRF